MKNLKLIVILFSILYANLCYSQSGWFWQNPLPEGLNFTKLDFLDENTGFVRGSSYILKTTNQGIDWFWVMGGSCTNDIDFINNSTGYSIDFSCGLQKTTNDGLNWSQLYFTPNMNPEPKVYFINTQTGFIGVQNNNWDNLYRTNDGGITWIHPIIDPVTVPTITSFCFLNNYTGYATNEFFSAIKTTDQGMTWKAMDINYTSFLKSVYFTDVNTGYITGGEYTQLWERIFKTTNGGLNWLQQVTPNRKAKLNDLVFINSNTGFIVADSGLILKTIDGGLNWNEGNIGSNTTLQSILYLNSNTGFLCGNSGKIYKTSNQGFNYETKNYILDDTLKSIMFVDSSIGYAVGNNGLIIKDSCGFWFKLQSKSGVNFTSVFFNNIYTGFCASQNGKIYKSTNGGYTWIDYQTNSFAIINCIKFINANTGYLVGDSGLIMKTINSGNNWENLPSGSNMNLFKLSTVDTNEVIIVGDNGTIIKTTNSGLNWIIHSSGQAKRLKSIHALSNQLYYVVGDSALFLKSTNGGANWQSINLPAFTYNLNDVKFVNSNTGYIAGSTGKILKTTNAGQNWGFQLTNVTQNLNELFMVNSSIGYVVGDKGVIRKTMNAGGNIITSLVSQEETPVNFSISQNYPNPFNPQTKIKFSIPLSRGVTADGGRGVFVSLIIYDLLGCEVATLVNEELKPGTYEADWDGSNYSSGVYFYKLIVDDPSTGSGRGFVETKKMVLMK